MNDENVSSSYGRVRESKSRKGMKNANQYISIDKDIGGGVPVFAGTRVAIKALFDHLEDGSLDEFLEGFPSVSRQQAEAVIELAAQRLLADVLE